MYHLRYIGPYPTQYIASQDGRTRPRDVNPGDEVVSVFDWSGSPHWERSGPPPAPAPSPGPGGIPPWPTVRALKFPEALDLLEPFGIKARSWKELQAEHWRACN